MFRTNPVIDRFFDFFFLPKSYFELIKSNVCPRSKWGIAIDLLTLFFKYKTYPDHYLLCHLWEVNKSDWKYYYGSNYRSFQRAKLRRDVQPSVYAILFDDKAICERLCREIGVRTPRTYGIIRPAQNYREIIRTWIRGSAVDTLFIKPLRGSGGQGIVLARRRGEDVDIQSGTGRIPLSEFVLDKEAIVQEAVKQDVRMSAFSLASLNTVRIVTMLTKQESVFILAATMRSGVGESYVDNWCAGGIGIGIDQDIGRLKQIGTDKRGRQYFEHPSAKIRFEGFMIPQWDQMVELAFKVQRAFSCYRILGMDIALSEGGNPILIEVNDSPDLMGMELSCGPLLRNEKNLRAFGEEDLLINHYQKTLYDRLVKA